jgi:hypothetical protein
MSSKQLHFFISHLAKAKADFSVQRNYKFFSAPFVFRLWWTAEGFQLLTISIEQGIVNKDAFWRYVQCKYMYNVFEFVNVPISIAHVYN